MKQYLMLRGNSNLRIACECPKICPICNNNISPINEFEKANIDINLVSILFTCPACGKSFLTHYNYEKYKVESYKEHSYYSLTLLESFPVKPKEAIFEECIHNLSPTFCNIYNQAVASETYGLDQLSGIGYRKAIEFLIKDFCIYKHPNDEEKIKSTLLGQVIITYIDETSKIRTLAKVSVWLGNDETHYIKKFDDKDINDLKRFIRATVSYITYELVSDEAEDLLNT
ncbi:MAG TPA: DUF4145 domain-containing protein [Candidatus Onthousia faecavium]|nr:DUF4145 domain-containing protein [Candidatus Onthousia faecavium]